MSKSTTGKDLDLKALILEVLEANRTMAVATIRPDGWPHATVVGYVHNDLELYFAIARTSQKLANLAQDPRMSVAIGGHGEDPHDTRGLSMAATASEVTDLREVARLNAMIAARYPEQAVFSPRGASIAMMRATPEIVSLIHPAAGLAQPALLKVEREMSVRPHVPTEAPQEASGPSWTLG